MDESNFQSFLEYQRARGALDSSGGFTIDYSKARIKLGRYQLDDQAAYLLKLVQAGVALGAEDIEIRLASRSVQVDFVGTESSLSAGEFIELLQKPIMAGRPKAHDFLASGLNAAQASKVSVRDTRAGWRLELTEGVELTEEQPEEAARLAIEITRASSSLSAAARAAEAKALTDRCQFCPVEVKLDSVSLNLLSSVPFYAEARHAELPGPSLYLAEGLQVETTLSGLGLPPENARQPGIEYVGQTRVETGARFPEVFVAWRDQPVPPRMIKVESVVLIPRTLFGRGTILLVSHGIVLEKRHCDLGCPGVLAALCVDDVATDLSGLQLSEPIDERLGALGRMTVHLVELIRTELPNLHLAVTEGHYILPRSLVGGLLGLGLSWFGGPLAPLIGSWALVKGVVAGTIGSWAYNRGTGANQKLARLIRQEIEENLPQPTALEF
ncbi:MAG: hypothetical protein KC910_00575 [Candidatus Eremiobacteraeota bacterium]|nr:hypothetical protein [Candidatus Eremiobacteraeota bacterium]